MGGLTLVERSSLNLSNSGSACVSGSSRYSGGCASSDERRLKDITSPYRQRKRNWLQYTYNTMTMNGRILRPGKQGHVGCYIGT